MKTFIGSVLIKFHSSTPKDAINELQKDMAFTPLDSHSVLIGVVEEGRNAKSATNKMIKRIKQTLNKKYYLGSTTRGHRIKYHFEFEVVSHGEAEEIKNFIQNH